MKKKGYYIHFAGREISGLEKKIDSQVSELNNWVNCEEIELQTSERSWVERMVGLLPFVSLPWNYDSALNQINEADFFYIRRTTADRGYINFLKILRIKYPQSKIIVEIPTYPYLRDGYMSWNTWPFLIKEVYYRRKYKRYIDRFSTYSRDTSILGVQTIQIKNGIKVEEIKPIVDYDENGIIDLVMVAQMQPHHGYERLLLGLKEYYSKGKKRKICCHFVGEGSEEKYYKKIVRENNLDDYVIFHGFANGEDLDRIYNICDIGVTALGMYKGKVFLSSELKVREYLAKGLPMIVGAIQDVFLDRQEDFYLQFENNNTILDVDNIVQFYDEIYKLDRDSLHSRIRKYAFENVDISVTFKPVINYILEME